MKSPISSYVHPLQFRRLRGWLNYKVLQTLIFKTANRETECTVEVVAVDIAAGAAQAASQGIGPGRDGGGPPKSAIGHVVENSEVEPKAARQGSEPR